MALGSGGEQGQAFREVKGRSCEPPKKTWIRK